MSEPSRDSDQAPPPEHDASSNRGQFSFVGTSELDPASSSNDPAELDVFNNKALRVLRDSLRGFLIQVADESDLWLPSIQELRLMKSLSDEDKRITDWPAGWNDAVAQNLDGIAEECTRHAASLALTGQIERSEQIRNVGCSIQEHRDAISEVESLLTGNREQTLDSIIDLMQSYNNKELPPMKMKPSHLDVSHMWTMHSRTRKMASRVDLIKMNALLSVYEQQTAREKSTVNSGTPKSGIKGEPMPSIPEGNSGVV